MFVCLCHAVTDRDINKAINDGLQTVPKLMNELKVATQCGSCLDEVIKILGAERSNLSCGDKNEYPSSFSQAQIYRP